MMPQAGYAWQGGRAARPDKPVQPGRVSAVAIAVSLP